QVEVILPDRPGMPAGIDVPDVRHVLLFQGSVERFTRSHQRVGVAARNPEEPQVLAGVGAGNEVAPSPEKGRGEAADRTEGIEVLQANGERLPAAHRQPGDGPVLDAGLYRVVRVDVRDEVFQQVVLETGVRSKAAPGRGHKAANRLGDLLLL